MKKITVFTPTYNRAHTLTRLYESLLRQTSKDFCWLIVDDGSIDGTNKLINQFICENKIEIKYIYQENRGKSQSHNKGVEETYTDLFTCVDSDDYLADNAIEVIIKEWKSLEINRNCIGIVAKCIFSDGIELTKINCQKMQTPFSTLRDAYRKGYISGDTILIYRTCLLKKYSFPYYEGEKFVPESYLYDKLDGEGLLRFLDMALYVREYQQDGYSHNMHKLIYSNPMGYITYIKQRLQLDKDSSIITLLQDIIRYESVAFIKKKKLIYLPNKMLSILCLPLGYMAFLIRFKRFMKEPKHLGKEI